MDAAPLLLAALLTGCPSGHDPWDLDGDGYDENVDCNDHNDDVHPGAEEACNGRDDDCDGEVDEGAATSTWYRDSDGDGWGTEDDTVISCLTPSGYLLVGGDCDDGDRDIHPEATDMACDGIDQDCDGEEVDCLGLADLPTWSSTVARDCAGRSVAGPGDVDGDGYDDLLVGAAGCTGASTGRAWLVRGEPSPVDARMPEVGLEFTGVGSYGAAGWTVAGAGDANVDGLADLLVGAPGEYSGAPSAGSVYLLFGGAALAGGSLEAADGIIHGIEQSGSLGVGLAGGGDLNGDGLDDVLLGASDADTAADNGGAVYLFLGPLAPGERGVDAADARLPGTAAYGEAGSSLAFAGDTDGDGWGEAQPVAAGVAAGRDCDDLSDKAASTFPGSASLEGPEDYTLDQDGDGYGADRPAVAGVVPGRDCCDACAYNWQTFPDAAPLDSATACMRDHDGDGWGDAIPGAGRIVPGSDCDDGDDADLAIRPGAAEVCDGLDQDCDGEIDEGVTTDAWLDADGDGYGDPATLTGLCTLADPWIGNGGDCDDSDPEVHPGALEWCDEVDDDCDGALDVGVAWADWYRDADGDGWGSDSDVVNDCAQPSGNIAVGGDCEGSDPALFPGAPDPPCDGIDQDCDGVGERECELGLAGVTWISV